MFIDWTRVDWLTDCRLTGWLSDWLIDSLIDWLIDGLIDWFLVKESLETAEKESFLAEKSYNGAQAHIGDPSHSSDLSQSGDPSHTVDPSHGYLADDLEGALQGRSQHSDQGHHRGDQKHRSEDKQVGEQGQVGEHSPAAYIDPAPQPDIEPSHKTSVIQANKQSSSKQGKRTFDSFTIHQDLTCFLSKSVGACPLPWTHFFFDFFTFFFPLSLQ